MAKLGFIAKKVKFRENIMASICDEELIDTTLKNHELEMNISRAYFGNDKISLEEALEVIRTSQIVNLAGNRIVDETIQAKYATRLAIRKIGSTSFLMIFKF